MSLPYLKTSLNRKAKNDLQSDFLGMPDEMIGHMLPFLLPKDSREHRLWENFGTYLFNLMTATRFKTDLPWQMLYTHLFSTEKSLKVENFPNGVFKEPGNDHRVWFLQLIMDYDKERRVFIQGLRGSKKFFYNAENPIIGWKNDDYPIAKEMMDQNAAYFPYLSQRVKDTKSFVLSVLNGITYLEFNDLSAKLRQDRDIVLACVERNECYVVDLPQWWDDREIVLQAIARNPYVLSRDSFNRRIKEDREIVIQAVASNPFVLRFFPSSIREDRGIILAAVQKTPSALYLLPAWHGDREIVMACIEEDGHALSYLSQWWADKDVVLTAAQRYGLIVQIIPEHNLNKEIVLAAVKQNSNVLDYLSREWLQDNDIAEAAV